MVVVGRQLFWWCGHQTRTIWYRRHLQKKANSDSDDNKLEQKTTERYFGVIRIHIYK